MSARAVCDCGWTSAPTTPAHARRVADLHSCESVARRQAARDRAAARRDADGPRRDCTHPRARHQHGTRTAYVRDACRCKDCRAANRAAEATRARMQAYGQWQPLVDATPARDHVRALMAAGFAWQEQAKVSGVGGGVMTRLLYGKDGNLPSRRVRPATAARILAVALDQAPAKPGHLFDANGTRLRLQALVALGWTQTELARRVGWTASNLGAYISDRRSGKVSRATRDTVAALYDDLAMTPGPSTRARRHAAARGWVPPLGVDDDLLDTPGYRPDPGVRRSDGRGAWTAREDILELLAHGETHAAIAARLGISEAAVDRARYERRSAS